jgi:hypothetical protein
MAPSLLRLLGAIALLRRSLRDAIGLEIFLVRHALADVAQLVGLLVVELRGVLPALLAHALAVLLLLILIVLLALRALLHRILALPLLDLTILAVSLARARLGLTLLPRPLGILAVLASLILCLRLPGVLGHGASPG